MNMEFNLNIFINRKSYYKLIFLNYLKNIFYHNIRIIKDKKLIIFQKIIYYKLYY